MVRKLRNSSLLSRAVTTTRIRPSCGSKVAVNLPDLPEGRIDQRMIWPKSLS